jgi:hypothetical protein
MKALKLPIVRIAVIAAVTAVIVAGAWLWQHQPGLITPQSPNAERIMLSGTVTAYDPRPSYTDGPIIFAIDGRAVDIGGGMRPATKMGSVYTDIKQGDEVVALVIRNDQGHFTIWDCDDCFVRLKLEQK